MNSDSVGKRVAGVARAYDGDAIERKEFSCLGESSCQMRRTSVLELETESFLATDDQ